MPTSPEADNRSPWYEPFARAAEPPPTRWLAGTKVTAPAADEVAEHAVGGGSEDQWATEALFDCYNG